jgi:DNA-binding XRE family transcriptional regulator
MDKYYFNNVFLIYRRKLGLTQEDFGKPLGVGLKTIHAIEYRRRNPSVKLIFKFCEVYGFQINLTKLSFPNKSVY